MTNSFQEEKFQVRVRLTGEFAKAARENPYDPVLKPLTDILLRNRGGLRCQLHEFRNFVEAGQAHEGGNSPLMQWTKAVLQDSKKVEKYQDMFVVQVNGEQLLDAATADRLVADLSGLLGQDVDKTKRISNDPAKNPQLPIHFRQS